MIKLSGIYRILCTKNNMSYIGHTTTSFSKRWKSHIKELTKGIHHCSSLQNDWNKYGINEFVFKILDIENDKLKCLTIEQSYINGMKDELYNSSLNNGLAKKVYIRKFDNTKIEIIKTIPKVIRRRGNKDVVIGKKNKEYYSIKNFDVWKWNGSSFNIISSNDIVFTKNNFDGINLLYDFDTGFFDTKTKEEKMALNVGLSTDFATVGEFVILRPTNRHDAHSILKIKEKGNGRLLLSNGRWVLPEMISLIDCIYDAELWP